MDPSTRARGPLLPFPEAERIDPLGALEAALPRIAAVLRATSSRRDVLATRSSIVLLVWRLRCPAQGRPRRSWYVPGAVTRQGAAGLRAAWRMRLESEPPSEKTLRRHLAALERACVLVTSPGDWIPYRRPIPAQRPRYPDTVHLLDDERAATWWAEVGADRLEAHPECAHNPDAWAQRFGDWRGEAAAFERQPELPFPEGDPEPEPGSGELADELETLSREARRGLELLARLGGLGIGIRGRPALELAGNATRLRGAVAMLARALRRGDSVRSPAGWIVRAYRRADGSELATALRRARTA